MKDYHYEQVQYHLGKIKEENKLNQEKFNRTTEAQSIFPIIHLKYYTNFPTRPSGNP